MDNKDLVQCIGLRVIRTGKVKKGDGDQQEVGTIVRQETGVDKTTYTVQWDSGTITYVDHPGQFEIRVLNVDSLGILHDIQCSGCNKAVRGFLWVCIDDQNQQLCNQCYHSDEGPINNDFCRFDCWTCDREEVTDVKQRTESLKVAVTGIFKQARVRQTDDDVYGKVESIHLQPNQLFPDVLVKWKHSTTETYHLGKDGIVRLKCDKPTSGGKYYVHHLPTPWELHQGKSARVDTKYQPQPGSVGELYLEKGDHITAICPRGKGMTYGVKNGTMGIFPSHCIPENEYDECVDIYNTKMTPKHINDGDAEQRDRVDRRHEQRSHSDSLSSRSSSFDSTKETEKPMRHNEPRRAAESDPIMHDTSAQSRPKERPPAPPVVHEHHGTVDQAAGHSGRRMPPPTPIDDNIDGDIYQNDDNIYSNSEDMPFPIYGNIDYPDMQPEPELPPRDDFAPERPPRVKYSPAIVRDKSHHKDHHTMKVKHQSLPLSVNLAVSRSTRETVHKHTTPSFEVKDFVRVIDDEVRFHEVQGDSLFSDFQQIRGQTGIVIDILPNTKSLLLAFPSVNVQAIIKAELVYLFTGTGIAQTIITAL